MGKFCVLLKGEQGNGARGLAHLLHRCSKSLFLLTIFAVTACSWPELPSLPSLPTFSFGGEGTDKRPAESCNKDTLERARNLDWRQAKTIDLHIRRERLVPSTLVMTAQTPNIIRIFNRDEGIRTFRAEAFFKNAALAAIYYDGRRVPETCINAIRIGPKKWAELHIVPLAPGDYPIGEDTPAAYSTEPAGKTGKIIVR